MKRRVSPSKAGPSAQNLEKEVHSGEKRASSASSSGLWVGHGDICAIPWVPSMPPGACSLSGSGTARGPPAQDKGMRSPWVKIVSEFSWLCQAGFSLSGPLSFSSSKLCPDYFCLQRVQWSITFLIVSSACRAPSGTSRVPIPTHPPCLTI